MKALRRAAAALSAFAFLAAAHAAEDKVQLYNFEGSLQLIRNKKTVEPSLDMPLKVGDRLRAGTETYADVTLNGRCGVRITDGSSMEVVKTSSSDMRLKLLEGSMLCHVRELGSSEIFVVETPAGQAKTTAKCQFSVRNSKDKTGVLVSTFILKKGVLTVTSRLASSSVILIEGQSVEIPEKAQIPAIRGSTDQEQEFTNAVLNVYVPEEDGA